MGRGGVGERGRGEGGVVVACSFIVLGWRCVPTCRVRLRLRLLFCWLDQMAPILGTRSRYGPLDLVALFPCVVSCCKPKP